LAVSWFDPVSVEVASGFCLLCIFELARVFGLPVRQSIGVGAMFAMPALGPLAGCPKINKLSHSKPRRYLDTFDPYLKFPPCIGIK
jgi:hypothetical protein